MEHLERSREGNMLRTLWIAFLLCNVLLGSAKSTDVPQTNDDSKKYVLEGRIINIPLGNSTNDIVLSLRGDDGTSRTIMRTDGNFRFADVSKGSYLLQISSTDYLFPFIRVDVTKNSQVRAFKQMSAGEDRDLLPYPLRISPDAPADFFLVKEGFQVMSLIKNPMIIMMGVTLIFTMVIPKMLSGIDQEAMAELTKKEGETEVKEPPIKWAAPALRLK
eukprot:TRINITY_DN201_c0_g1_i1.p1 TRINITY_DN201_c0_g1~~TRINITY_DN201_c0_g1_i1.p1  ORF type:complete len:218 (+),score=38.77 TRINITY_DN201_c0_g1_i1:3-656(+)